MSQPLAIEVKAQKFNPDGTNHGQGSWFAIADSKNRASKGKGSWFGDYATMKEGVKQGGDWFNKSQPSISRMCSSKSLQRKMASAMIAKIPLPLSRHIAATFAVSPC